MAAAEVRAALGRARQAGAALRGGMRLAERVRAVGAVLDGLGDPTSAIRRRLEADLPEATGFSPENVRAGLDLAASGWSTGGLEALVAREGATDASAAPATTAVVLAGAIPMPTIEALYAPLLLGSAALVRLGSGDAVTAPAFRDALREAAPLLGDAVEIVGFPHTDEAALGAFLEADAVLASGSDATIARLRERVGPRRRFVGYGHRFSIAVVGAGGEEACAPALARDVCLWDQLGCLSPVAVFTPGDADRLADALAAALEACATALPRGALDLPAAAAWRQARDAVALRTAAGEHVRALGGTEWLVAREPDARLRPGPLHRFVRVHPARSLDEVGRGLGRAASQLSSIGHAGLQPAARSALAKLGGFRMAPVGELQAPANDWNHDGIGVLAPLLGRPGRRGPG